MFIIGGLIVLGLFMNGWSVEEGLENFMRLAKQAFKAPSSSIGKTLHGLLMSIFTDSRYGSKNIENALLEAFGSDRTMLGWTETGNHRTRVAVTATSPATATPCIFSNYTGNTRLVNCGLFTPNPSPSALGGGEATRRLREVRGFPGNRKPSCLRDLPCLYSTH